MQVKASKILYSVKIKLRHNEELKAPSWLLKQLVRSVTRIVKKFYRLPMDN